MTRRSLFAGLAALVAPLFGLVKRAHANESVTSPLLSNDGDICFDSASGKLRLCLDGTVRTYRGLRLENLTFGLEGDDKLCASLRFVSQAEPLTNAEPTIYFGVTKDGGDVFYDRDLVMPGKESLRSGETIVLNGTFDGSLK